MENGKAISSLDDDDDDDEAEEVDPDFVLTPFLVRLEKEKG